eukprot:TRINITY_DN47012_c0_g1_i1.p1 TRINITY_DN47012_c0_g1~~TRINITY_DN47012_c0_g1_i1.p1  ORF type:complete len:258 (+),score=45.58 TRINITY_DN47012_c0_g1_i1:52-825(+)
MFDLSDPAQQASAAASQSFGGTVNLSAGGPSHPSAYAPQQAQFGGGGYSQYAGGSQASQPPSQASFDPNMAAQQAMQEVAGTMARSAVERATGLLQKGAGEIRIFVEKNHYSVHALSLLGGLTLAAVSTLGLLNVFASITGPLTYVLHFYQLLFASLICVVDGPGDKVPRLQALVVSYAPFLHTNVGRSLFYLFIACLEGSQDSWIHDLVGWYFGVIAVMHVALKFKSLTAGASEPSFVHDAPLLTAPSGNVNGVGP